MNIPKAKLLIVEDEILLAQDLAMSLAPKYEILGIASSVSEAEIKMASGNKPDIVLIDIILKGDRDGIDLAEIINEQYQIPFIFITSHADIHLVDRAKKVRPHAYLLKPYSDREISIAIELALTNFERKIMAHSPDQTKELLASENRVLNLCNSLFLKKDNYFQRVNLDEILVLEADNNYTTIYTNQDRFIYSIVLKKMEEKLPKTSFMRVHRSYVINIKAIDGFEGNTLFIQKKSIPVSKQYREEVFRMFQAF